MRSDTRYLFIGTIEDSVPSRPFFGQSVMNMELGFPLFREESSYAEAAIFSCSHRRIDPENCCFSQEANVELWAGCQGPLSLVLVLVMSTLNPLSPHDQPSFG